MEKVRRAGTTPILFPSGEDANPLNRRLPAEVVSRRRPVPRAQKTEERPAEEVEVDLKVVLALRAEGRLKWLVKAFKMAEEGRASASELYNIISSRKFASGLPAKIGRKLHGIVRENLELFSDKQQRYLQSRECPLHANYSGERGGDGNSDDEDADAAVRTEDMMARCRNFVREKAATFDDRAAEVAETERKARDQAILEYERAGMDAADLRLRQRTREALEAEERTRREEREREERELRQALEAALAKRRAFEEQMARKRRLEDEVDNSMQILERHRHPSPAREPIARVVPKDRTSREKQRGLSRSRSISSGGAKRSLSSSRGRDRSRQPGRRDRSRSRDRSRERRRRKDSSSSRQRDRRRR